MTTAVIFIPAEHLATYSAACFDYCAARSYEVVGLVTTSSEAATRMLVDGIANVMVVARRDHLDPEREPRVEVLAEQASPAPRQQRTRIIPRDAAR